MRTTVLQNGVHRSHRDQPSASCPSPFVIHHVGWRITYQLYPHQHISKMNFVIRLLQQQIVDHDDDSHQPPFPPSPPLHCVHFEFDATTCSHRSPSRRLLPQPMDFHQKQNERKILSLPDTFHGKESFIRACQSGTNMLAFACRFKDGEFRCSGELHDPAVLHCPSCCSSHPSFPSSMQSLR